MKVFDAEEILDTDPHESEVYPNMVGASTYARIIAIRKTILYKNGLNEDCSLQVQGSVDEAFTDPVDVGTAIAAGTGMFVPLYETSSDYFPYLRVVATCSVQPLMGSLDVWILP